MGAVYLAERADDQYRKQVALKVLPAWSAGSERRLHRFLEERQILAALEHPDIARLLDGGVTSDGLPWFAMEFVEGVDMDRYCDDLELPIAERLELFCRVCGAVQYAHRNLVVHRDLKPANILMTSDGQVKLLDFGIAKLLDSGAAPALTMTGERVLTPLYASPEQLRDEPVSTASDVYSLGVLLNVLLTGTYPYRLASRQQHEVARAVLEQDPQRPSDLVAAAPVGASATLPSPADVARARGTTPARLRRLLHGDLDAIVLKALEKDPGRRYGTAEQLENDVRRHLSCLPVTARAATRFYNARRFLRRHRTGSAAAAAGAVLVLAFTAVTAVQSARIRSQAQRIAAERDLAQAFSRMLTNIFQSSVASPRAGRGVTAREVLDSAAAQMERDATSPPEARAGMMLEMGRAYEQLGIPDRARDLLAGAVALSRTLPRQHSGTLAQSLDLLGAVQLAEGELASAERAYGEALALRRGLPGNGQSDVARSLNGLAAVFRAQGRLREAEYLSREALAIHSTRPGQDRGSHARSLRGLADALLDKGDYAAAEPLYRQALVLLGEQLPEENAETANTMFGLAGALRGLGRAAAADSLIRQGVALYRRIEPVRMPAWLEPALGTLPVDFMPGEPLQASASAAMARPAGTVASRIVFVSDRDGPDPVGHLGNQEIYVMHPDGTEQTRITVNDAIDGGPGWSPDGAAIAFARQSEAGLDIFMVALAGGEPTRVTNLAGSDLAGAAEPAWSPDGRTIAFHSRVNPDIHVISVDGTGLRNLTNSPRADMHPAWSPDGSRIAFTTNRDRNAEIYVMNADGSVPVRLTFEPAADRWPAWSPDGSRIAFMSERDGNREIYVMNADGTRPRRVTNDPAEDGKPSWSPDGRRIVFHRRVLGHLQIFVMNADGSEPTRITEASTTVFNGWASWGPAPAAIRPAR
jgi:tetratricopeptide (TPR) repeat protein